MRFRRAPKAPRNARELASLMTEAMYEFEGLVRGLPPRGRVDLQGLQWVLDNYFSREMERDLKKIYYEIRHPNSIYKDISFTSMFEDLFDRVVPKIRRKLEDGVATREDVMEIYQGLYSLSASMRSTLESSDK